MNMKTILLVAVVLGTGACKNNDATTQTTTTTASDTKPVAADNTKVNDRDRHDTITPTDQGNSKSETDITAAVRKAIVADGDLSFDAKNAKVVTTGTKVTLRGPVKSAEERAAIEQLARKTAGVTEVDNQLEVKK